MHMCYIDQIKKNCETNRLAFYFIINCAKDKNVLWKWYLGYDCLENRYINLFIYNHVRVHTLSHFHHLSLSLLLFLTYSHPFIHSFAAMHRAVDSYGYSHRCRVNDWIYSLSLILYIFSFNLAFDLYTYHFHIELIQ